MPYRPTGKPRGRPPYAGPLTPAEERVLELVREGLPNAGIAVRLGISVETVKTHVWAMLGKLHLEDRRTLATWQPESAAVRARRWGFVATALARATSTPVAAIVGGLTLASAAVGVTVLLVFALVARTE